jgi:hypothetical protein
MPEFIDLTGKRFGRWEVLGLAEPRCLRNGKTTYYWKARCDCGRIRVVQGTNLKTGHSKSCGCLSGGGSPNELKAKYPQEYEVWAGMKERCSNRNRRGSRNYIGRGITVCEKWRHSFKAFIADMGPRPSPRHSIDRIDNDRGYEPGNCRWATMTQQHRNRRSNHLLTFQGRTMTVTEWASVVGIKASTLFTRISKEKWSTERALTTPVQLQKH